MTPKCSCGKYPFPSKKKAQAVRRSRFRNKGLEVYRCQFQPLYVDVWHLGGSHGLTREEHRELHSA